MPIKQILAYIDMLKVQFSQARTHEEQFKIAHSLLILRQSLEEEMLKHFDLMREVS